MAIILGVNSGFVTEAPTGDPGAGTSTGDFDGRTIAKPDVSPEENVRIIEIGWWCSNATEEANFEVGIYDDSAGEPNNLLSGESRTNAKGTTLGWKVVTGLDIAISSSTNYWIAIQLDNTTTTTTTDTGSFGTGDTRKKSETTLADPYGTADDSGNRIPAIYALVETLAPTTFTRKIKIAGTFVDKPIKTKVGGTFVDKPIKIKVGGTFQDA